MPAKKDKTDVFLALFFVFLVLGYLVHQSETFAGSFSGHILGIAGGAFIFLALLYPFRKRVLGKRGKENPLHRHILYGLLGACLVVVHSAHKFSSLIGVLTFLALLVLVLSGIVGKFLYRKVNRTLRVQKGDLKLLREHFALTREKLKACEIVTEQGNERGGDDPVIEDQDMAEACKGLLDETYAIAELEYSVSAFEWTKKLFSKWVQVHYLLTFFLLAMLVVHVLTTFYYGIRWLP
ncbi:MAG: hypothetical protein JRI80_04165 [Deltaproteobacteria bacterium]|nr:hypothetical protein [Deltaproteobacteria bacterium]